MVMLTAGIRALCTLADNYSSLNEAGGACACVVPGDPVTVWEAMGIASLLGIILCEFCLACSTVPALHVMSLSCGEASSGCFSHVSAFEHANQVCINQWRHILQLLQVCFTSSRILSCSVLICCVRHNNHCCFFSCS